MGETEDDMKPNEFVLRRLLWLRHGCPIHALYGDDGEMQCGICLIDFKRDSVLQIENVFHRIGLNAYIKSQKEERLKEELCEEVK